MPWRGHDALYCKVCGRHRDEVGPLSARYKCRQCGQRRQRENVEQLWTQQGPYFEAWRSGLYTSAVEWLVKTGQVAEAHKQYLLDTFNERGMILARYDETHDGAGRPLPLKKVGKGLPTIATARQRRVSTELREHYCKEKGNLAQSIFLAAMNIHMQYGTPRLEAERRVVKSIREKHPGFSPVRV
jgi:hypothetical protein